MGKERFISYLEAENLTVNNLNNEEIIFLGKIGNGGFANVYLSYLKENANLVALKVIENARRPISINSINHEDMLLQKIEKIRVDPNFPDAWRYFPKYYGLLYMKFPKEEEYSYIFPIEPGLVTLDEIAKIHYFKEEEKYYIFYMKWSKVMQYCSKIE